jgi:hypothetical protein
MMITIQVKNMAGDLMSMDISPQESRATFHKRLASMVCPSQPYRLVLLRRVRAPPVPAEMTEEEQSRLLDEIYAMAQEEEEEEEEEEGWKGDWQEGDRVDYMINDSLCVRLSEDFSPYYVIEDERERDPFYLVTIMVEYEGTPYKPIYEYDFLFRLRGGTFHPPRSWEVFDDDSNTYVRFLSFISYTSIQEMLLAEQEKEEEHEVIPPLYLERMCRSITRKWIHFLQHMRQFRFAERRIAERLHNRSRLQTILQEKQLWKKHYLKEKGKILMASAIHKSARTALCPSDPLTASSLRSSDDDLKEAS